MSRNGIYIKLVCVDTTCDAVGGPVTNSEVFYLTTLVGVLFLPIVDHEQQKQSIHPDECMRGGGIFSASFKGKWGMGGGGQPSESSLKQNFAPCKLRLESFGCLGWLDSPIKSVNLATTA